MSIDSVGNFLTVIRNGVMVAKPFVIVPFAKIRHNIALILKEEGFIKDIEIIGEMPAEKKLKVYLKYKNGESVIHDITRVSTPGRRRYSAIKEVKPVIGGMGVTILTTNHGIITNKKAKQLGVGGELICTVW